VSPLRSATALGPKHLRHSYFAAGAPVDPNKINLHEGAVDCIGDFAGPPDDGQAEPDRGGLVAEVVAQELWEGGAKNTDEEVGMIQLAIAGGKITVKAEGAEASGGIALDDSKTPHWITLKLEADGETATISGIYEVNNGILKFCHPEQEGERPVSFEKSAGFVLLILKKDAGAPAVPEKPASAPAVEAKEKH
jgi:uncharacterized protein (TIGR03067 family)